ncbi:helix-turn-helix domain-containing protein [Streptomyces umbrinus]|uniref:helix-turn-helix domain-containing protein n=1 Tax=Streptomyces umbrinus TaxID=67370 RepID=UPI003C30A7C3
MRFNRPVKSGLPEARRELAESLREGARDSGLSSDQIARRAHATRGAVSQAMSGTRVPSRSLFRSIVRAMGHDPLSPRWLALYAAALAAVLAAIASIWGGSWLVASIGSEPGPPANKVPVVHVKTNAKLYEEPTGGRRADRTAERHYSDKTMPYYSVCVPEADDSSSPAPRYGLLYGSPESPLVYIDKRDLTIAPHELFEPCPAVVRIAPGARLYTHATGTERADKASERAHSSVKLTEHRVCREETASPTSHTRRYGLLDQSAERFIMYLDEGDLTIPAGARLNSCPLVVHIAKNAKLYQGPAGDERAAASTEQHLYSGPIVSTNDLCVVKADASSAGPQRFGYVRYVGDTPSAYIDQEDLLIPPTARFGTCEPVAHIEKDAKLYLNATGSERAARGTEGRFQDEYLDPTLLCLPYAGPSSPDPRRYGLRTYGQTAFAYVDIGDVVVPSATRIGVCL